MIFFFFFVLFKKRGKWYNMWLLRNMLIINRFPFYNRMTDKLTYRQTRTLNYHHTTYHIKILAFGYYSRTITYVHFKIYIYNIRNFSCDFYSFKITIIYSNSIILKTELCKPWADQWVQALVLWSPHEKFHSPLICCHDVVTRKWTKNLCLIRVLNS